MTHVVVGYYYHHQQSSSERSVWRGVYHWGPIASIVSIVSAHHTEGLGQDQAHGIPARCSLDLERCLSLADSLLDDGRVKRTQTVTICEPASEMPSVIVLVLFADFAPRLFPWHRSDGESIRRFIYTCWTRHLKVSDRPTSYNAVSRPAPYCKRKLQRLPPR